MTTIFKCLAGSRLYGTNNADSDTDYKSVFVPTKEQILLGRVPRTKSSSTGSDTGKNNADDTDNEAFSLQYFLKLASDMQTIPVEMLFVETDPLELIRGNPVWDKIVRNRDKILSNNTNSFVGYCKSQAVRYSMRGERLETYKNVVEVLEDCFMSPGNARQPTVWDCMGDLLLINGVKTVDKDHNGRTVRYLDVYGRQVPTTVRAVEAHAIYLKPVQQAGDRAKAALDNGGADLKALYHCMRIVEQGITLFGTGEITFPAKNREYLMKIRAGEVEKDAILDLFDEKLEILMDIGDKSPLADTPDYEWIDNFVLDVYERIVRA